MRSVPATLLTNRISELHRRLIDPASDLETVTSAKRALLRLLSDPMTLPVITTPPMQTPVWPSAKTARQSLKAKRVCEICDRALPSPRSQVRLSRRATTSRSRSPLHSLS